MAAHGGGDRDSHRIKAHCLCFGLHQRQVQLQDQQDTIHCTHGHYMSHWERDFQSFGVHLCAAKARQMQTHPARPLDETGNQDRNPSASSWPAFNDAEFNDLLCVRFCFITASMTLKGLSLHWAEAKTFQLDLYLKRKDALPIDTNTIGKVSTNQVQGNEGHSWPSLHTEHNRTNEAFISYRAVKPADVQRVHQLWQVSHWSTHFNPQQVFHAHSWLKTIARLQVSLFLN